MDGKSDKWSGMEGKREREMAVSAGGGVEEEFAVGCVVEQIETDTHPQQESLTPSRKHTHTHSSMQNANTHTDKQTCKDTPGTHAHTQDGELGVYAQRHTRCVGWLWPQQMLSMNILAKLSGRVSICMDQM